MADLRRSEGGEYFLHVVFTYCTIGRGWPHSPRCSAQRLSARTKLRVEPMLPAESPALQLSFEPLFKANAQNLAEKGTYARSLHESGPGFLLSSFFMKMAELSAAVAAPH